MLCAMLCCVLLLSLQEVIDMCNEQAELFDWFGRIASFLGGCVVGDSVRGLLSAQ